MKNQTKRWENIEKCGKLQNTLLKKQMETLMTKKKPGWNKRIKTDYQESGPYNKLNLMMIGSEGLN